MTSKSFIVPRCRLRAAAWALTGALVVWPAAESRAAFSENLGAGVVAMSLGNAVTADPSGLEAVHFNPAGLARLGGNWRQGAVFGAKLGASASFSAPPDFDVGGWTDDPVAGSSTGPVRSVLYLPGLGRVGKRTLPFAVAGSAGVSFNQPGSPWTFALGFYPTQSVNLDRTSDPNDPGRFDGRQVVLQRLVYLAPAVAFRASPTLSFGLSVPMAHQAFALNTDMRFPNTLLGLVAKVQEGWCTDAGNPIDVFVAGLCGGGPEGRLRPFGKVGGLDVDLTSSLDPTFNLGVLWEPNKRLAFGAVYQSGSRTTLSGTYRVEATPMLSKFVEGMYGSLFGPIIASTVGFPSSIPAAQRGNATMRLSFPERLQVGMKFKPLDRLQLNLDAGWTNWKRWNSVTIQFDQQISLLQVARLFGQTDASQLTLKRSYRNTITYGLGAQLQLTDRLVVRAGYEPRKSSVPSESMDLLAPLPDIKLYGLGVGYTMANGTRLDITGSYARGRYSIPANGSCNLNCTDFFNVIYNPYAGLDVRGDISLRYLGVSLTSNF